MTTREDARQRARTDQILAQLKTAQRSVEGLQIALFRTDTNGKNGYQVLSGPELEEAWDWIKTMEAQLTMMEGPILKWHRTHHIDQDIKSKLNKLWNHVFGKPNGKFK